MPLALSASVAVRWWPKALRAAAERELGQATELGGALDAQGTPPCKPDLLDMAGEAAELASTVLRLMEPEGPHAVTLRSTLRATLCSPATLASTLGNLAAVYARFARFPATFKDQAQQWFSLSVLAARLLDLPANQAVGTAVDRDRDVQAQLAAALQPYAAHLLEAIDLSNPPWCEAWGQLVPALATQAAWPWPNPEAGVVSQESAQRSAEVQQGLLRLLPLLGTLPQSHKFSWQWGSIPLLTTQAAAVAATKAFDWGRALSQREFQQRGLSWRLLPVAVDLFTASAGQLDAPGASPRGLELVMAHPVFAYGSAIIHLTGLLMAASQYCDSEEQWVVGIQTGELAAAAETALRLAGQATQLTEGLDSSADLEADVSRASLGLAERIFLHMPDIAEQEASPAPQPGGVRPSLQAQLRCVHTACKFARAALARDAAGSSSRGSSGGGSSSGSGTLGSLTGGAMSGLDLQIVVCQILERCNVLLATKVHPATTLEGRASLTPTEKRALIGAALAQTAASAAVVRLTHEGPGIHNAQRMRLVDQLCRLVVDPELAGALLARHAEVAEEFVGGLAVAMEGATDPRATPVTRAVPIDVLNYVHEAVHACRRLGPLLLCPPAGAALAAAVPQGLQGPAHEGVVGQALWVDLLAARVAAAYECFDSSGQAAAKRLQSMLGSPAGVQELQQEGWEALHAVRAAADAWLAQEAQQQWRQEQLLLCAEAAATRACANLACANLGGASEAGLKVRRCSGCRCAHYCSTACQRADWAAGHKAMCKRLQAGKAAGD